MLRIMGQTWGLTLLLGVLGALLGYGIDLALGTAGWGIIAASMGLCGGAVFAARLATEPPRGGAVPPPAPPAPTE